MKAKWIVILIAVAVLFGLALPISNLLVGPPMGTSLTKQTSPDPLFAKVAPVLEKKCVNCHTGEYKLPFYAQFPVAKTIIEQDIKLGLSYMDMASALFPGDGKPVGEVALAKIEQTVLEKTMPPMRYLALHWDGGLKPSEQNDVLAWLRDVRVKHYATQGIPLALQQEVIHPLPQKAGIDPQKAALGNKLFHDKRLSKDNSLACAGCHDLEKGGTDRKKFSEGVGGAVGGINAPTVYNAGFQFLQFWDGRAATLEEQADGPVNNPIEMASNWAEAIPKLQQDTELTQAFLAVYPAGYSKETITEAIAMFERTLITPNSKFDKFLLGDASALTEEEKRGYALFKKNNCATCHVGKILGGQSFEKIGLKADYLADRGNPTDADLGRFAVTKKEEDKYRLKVPTLRNIAQTAPYLHDATTDKLDSVVQTMMKYQVGKTLSAADTDTVVKFLHTLTGEYEGKLLQ